MKAVEMDRTHEIAAIIVTYNKLDYLKKCIASLLEQTVSDFDILIIDNASTDGTKKYISYNFSDKKRIRYFNTGKNTGGAGGFSYGVKQAVKLGYELIWLMDDDTIPAGDALEQLLKVNDKLYGKYGFLSSYAKWTDGTPCKMNVPNISDSWRDDIDVQFNNGLIRLKSASFVSLMTRSEVVRNVGLPIKDFFIWADDLEYTRRISKKYPCYFVYDSEVIHEMKTNSSTSIADSSPDRLNRYYFLFRNRYYLAKQGRFLDVLDYYSYLKNNICAVLKSHNGDKLKKIGIIIKSYVSGLFFNPKIEYIDEKRT